MIKLYSLEKGVRGPHCKDEDNHMVLKVYDCPTHQMRESNPKDENGSPQFCPSRLTLTRQASRPMPGDSAIRLVGWKAWQKLRDMRTPLEGVFRVPQGLRSLTRSHNAQNGTKWIIGSHVWHSRAVIVRDRWLTLLAAVVNNTLRPHPTPWPRIGWWRRWGAGIPARFSGGET